MPNELHFEIVPLSQVPLENAFTQSDITANRLEVLVDDGKICDVPSDILQRADALEIPGLPGGHKAWVTQQPGKFRLMLETCNGDAELMGEFPSLKDALHALARKLPAK
jgi:hypothetical protein